VTPPAQPWKAGDHLSHRFNPELGVGRITAVEGRALVVHFPKADKTLRIAAGSDALEPVASSGDRPGSGIRNPGFDRLNVPDLLRDVQRMRSIREGDVIGSFLGGRVRLFPHQLYVAARATVTAGLAKLVEEVNQYADVIHAATARGTAVARRRATPQITARSPKVATNSPASCPPP
jgi:hypothetical protein